MRWRDMWRACWLCSVPGRYRLQYGNNIRTHAKDAGVKNAFDIPGFVPEYIRPMFCFEGRGPFRWVALSGDPPRYLSNGTSSYSSLFGDKPEG